MSERNKKQRTENLSFVIKNYGYLAVNIAITIFWLANYNTALAQQPDTPALLQRGDRELFPGKTIDRPCSGKPDDQRHIYKTRLKAGEFFRLTIERDPTLSDGIDVRVSDPNAELFVKRFDQQKKHSLNYSAVAKITGGYTVEIICYETARYKITLVERRRAAAKEKRAKTGSIGRVSPQDIETRQAARAKAEFLTDRLRPNAAGQPLNWANESDLREIARRFAEGALWWHAAGNHAEEYEPLNEVAKSYGALNDFRAALETAEQSLTVARETDRSSLEFSALGIIGQI